MSGFSFFCSVYHLLLEGREPIVLQLIYFYSLKKQTNTSVITVGQMIVMLLTAFKGKTIDSSKIAAAGNALFAFAL